MTKQNDFRNIVNLASLNASKPDREEAWADLSAQLDEKMPIKKNRKRLVYFFLLIFLFTTLVSAIFFMNIDSTDDSTKSASQNEKAVNQNYLRDSENKGQTFNNKKVDINETLVEENNLIPKISAENENRNKGTKRNGNQVDVNKIRDDKESKPIYLVSNDKNKDPENIDPNSISEKKENYESLRNRESIRKEYLLVNTTDSSVKVISILSVGNEKDSLNESGEDKGKNKKNGPDPFPNHKFAIGGTLGYSFNNFTTRENRSQARLVNELYQATKQTSVNFYCRIPLNFGIQLQPELGIEPYSTHIEINYRTKGTEIFTRYDLQRMVYSQVGLSAFYEVKKDLYLYGGGYFAYVLPIYGARKETIHQKPNQSEIVLTSSNERQDFRKNVFDLKRNDLGIYGGFEYHFKNITTGFRVYRGFTDLTPETSFMYHNFNMSIKIGYHFELK